MPVEGWQEENQMSEQTEPPCTCPPEGSRPHPVDACYWHGDTGF